MTCIHHFFFLLEVDMELDMLVSNICLSTLFLAFEIVIQFYFFLYPYQHGGPDCAPAVLVSFRIGT